MKIIKISLIALLITLIASCIKDHTEVDISTLLDDIPKQKYYDSDIFDADQQDIYGTWKVIGTSGGFSGKGYDPVFDHLILKPNGIYGLIAHNTLLLSGKVSLLTDPNYDLFVTFTPDPLTPTDQLKYNLYDGSILIRSDTLDIIGPCCDLFNTQFKRVE